MLHATTSLMTWLCFFNRKREIFFRERKRNRKMHTSCFWQKSYVLCGALFIKELSSWEITRWTEFRGFCLTLEYCCDSRLRALARPLLTAFKIPSLAVQWHSLCDLPDFYSLFLQLRSRTLRVNVLFFFFFISLKEKPSCSLGNLSIASNRFLFSFDFFFPFFTERR